MNRWGVILLVIVWSTIALYGARVMLLPTAENEADALHTIITVKEGSSFGKVVDQIQETGFILSLIHI